LPSAAVSDVSSPAAASAGPPRTGREQEILEKACFTREGVLCCIGWRSGAWHDSIISGLSRTEP
jgi:hypothetical protein